MEVDILVAVMADIEAIYELQKLAFIQEAELYNNFKITPLTESIEAVEKDFRELTVLKAVENKRIIGSIRVSAPVNNTCAIYKLTVHPDYQNRSIGRDLMLKVEQLYPSGTRFELWTGHKSEKNISFYEKLGYNKYGKKTIGANPTLICLEKWI
ncbi:MAG: ribosomal protein S18 acetylase RimI-like enzyme [Arcticibacterium sp.]|jgi:ribosomal protein S18 acetylase RimI-like enzyme